jgi:FkbM family methyltransferase
MDALSLRLAGGTILVVPPSLEAITTYVLLEQEKWFEKEVIFLDAWLRPGMCVIDIGAHLGVYAVSAARKVGPGGHVYAYEPAAEARSYLRRSVEANGLTNLDILPAALSDTPRYGFLFHGGSGELHSLGGRGTGENISITSLDADDNIRDWPSPDLVKIDAEGEEVRIVKGAQAFFSRHSPLVMFEIKAGDKPSLDLLPYLEALGYRVFRALGGSPLLVPFDANAPLDIFELNLFAAKADRVAHLAAEGLLVNSIPKWIPDEAARTKALEAPHRFAYADAFTGLFEKHTPLDPLYRDALAGLAAWKDAALPLNERHAALEFSEQTLARLCETRPTLARLSTLARASWETGRRIHTVNALYAFSAILQRGSRTLDEPFWPANPRFDAIDPGKNQQDWFFGGTLEQLVLAERFSSLYGPAPVNLAWLETLAFTSAEISRRRMLDALRAGQTFVVPERLKADAADHLNAEIWRAGTPPLGLS